ncbi:MAG TPA: efflux RND transporter permease subunit, partial [Bacteroidales bacterium]|nr:efflux RND transporter permease subunit [Bacteroidales bacterium]
FAIFITSMVVAKYLKTDFIPQADEGRISAEIQLQPGIRVNETVKIARKIEDFINAEVPEKQIISISSGANDQGGFLALFQNSGSNIINITMRLSDKTQRKRSSNDIADLIRKYLAEIPEIVKFKVNTTSRGMRSAGGGNTVDVNIYGYDFNQTTTIANDLAERIKKINGARDVTISREDPKPELRIILDKEKMARMGLNTATLSALVRNRVYGYTASTYREEGNEYNIVVKFDDKFKTSFSDIENIGILTPSGVVRLGDVGKIEQHWAPPTIQRQRRERIVTISTTPYKISLGELANKIQAEVDKTNKPSNVIIDVGGSYQDLKESFSDLALLLVLSLILVYIVMASQFESLKMPLIIMISVPFAFTGVILALLITKTTLSVIAALGAIMLIGIVVKNAIVMVDFTNLMRERGYELDDAIKLAGRSRLRPILMTTITTILGMLPLALSTGEGSEIWSPMGISVIGGLTFSTIITLIIVPVAYRIVVKRSYKKIDKELVEVIA